MTDRHGLCQTYLIQARVAFRQGEYETALAACDDAVCLASDEGLRTAEPFGNALQANDAASDDLPEAVEALRFRARVRWHLKQYDMALLDCEEAIRLEPHHPRGYYYRGRVHLWMRAYRLAIADFDHALEISPAHTAARQCRAKAIEAQRIAGGGG